MGSPGEQALAAVDSLRENMVAFTSDLVRIPTVNPPGEAYRERSQVPPEIEDVRKPRLGETRRYADNRRRTGGSCCELGVAAGGQGVRTSER